MSTTSVLIAERREVITLLVEAYAFAVTVATLGSYLLKRFVGAPFEVAMAVSFFAAALLFFPAARVLYRTKGHTLSFIRYASIWFGVSVFAMLGMGLTSGC